MWRGYPKAQLFTSLYLLSLSGRIWAWSAEGKSGVRVDERGPLKPEKGISTG